MLENTVEIQRDGNTDNDGIPHNVSAKENFSSVLSLRTFFCTERRDHRLPVNSFAT